MAAYITIAILIFLVPCTQQPQNIQLNAHSAYDDWLEWVQSDEGLQSPTASQKNSDNTNHDSHIPIEYAKSPKKNIPPSLELEIQHISPLATNLMNVAITLREYSRFLTSARRNPEKLMSFELFIQNPNFLWTGKVETKGRWCGRIVSSIGTVGFVAAQVTRGKKFKNLKIGDQVFFKYGRDPWDRHVEAKDIQSFSTPVLNIPY